MKKSLFIFIAAMILLACVSGACAKAPAGEATVPTQLPEATEAPQTTPYETVSETEPAGTDAPSGDMLLPSPPHDIFEVFSSYTELASAFSDSSSNEYAKLHTCYYAGGMEALGLAYNTFINGLESGELTLPLPLIDGEPVELTEPDCKIWVFSRERFNLPMIAYDTTYGDFRVMFELQPLSVADGLELTGNETFSDVSKILAPRYPTEDTPKEQYPDWYISVTAHEIMLANGIKVMATVFEWTHNDGIRTTYRLIYGDYIVSIWARSNGKETKLPDDFFSHFSLGGSITDFQQ